MKNLLRFMMLLEAGVLLILPGCGRSSKQHNPTVQKREPASTSSLHMDPRTAHLPPGVRLPRSANPDEIPDFVLETAGGEEFAMSSARGKVVVLNFFAVGCIPCRKEAPALVELHRRYKRQGLMLVSVNAWNDERSAVSLYAGQYRLPAPVLLNGKALATRLGITGVPHTLWIDREGRIVNSHEGYKGATRTGLDRRTREALGLSGRTGP